jgi:glyoxalase family protein
MKPLLGIHHITAIASDAAKIYPFFVEILGLRLAKKTVNQDDVQAYHLFFTDDLGSPGTDMTFFDFPGINPAKHGTNEISHSGFRVPSDEALTYWVKRFDHFKVNHHGIQTLLGKRVVFFEDADTQQYFLISDEGDTGVAPGQPWSHSSVPQAYSIVGLGPVIFTLSDAERMDRILKTVLEMRLSLSEDNVRLYEMGPGGNGGSVIVKVDPSLPPSYQGYGAVHHVAFRIEDKTHLDAWIERLNTVGARHSGFVDRFYFKSLYSRLHPGILFEFATEGPGFVDEDESLEHLGETLALPPAFTSQRARIESIVRPLDTSDVNRQREKLTF